MTQVTEATFDGGVLRPRDQLNLRPHERVRIIVLSLEPSDPDARKQAMQRLRAGIAKMNFRSTGSFPTRDELHERG